MFNRRHEEDWQLHSWAAGSQGDPLQIWKLLSHTHIIHLEVGGWCESSKLNGHRWKSETTPAQRWNWKDNTWDMGQVIKHLYIKNISPHFAWITKMSRLLDEGQLGSGQNQHHECKVILTFLSLSQVCCMEKVDAWASCLSKGCKNCKGKESYQKIQLSGWKNQRIRTHTSTVLKPTDMEPSLSTATLIRLVSLWKAGPKMCASLSFHNSSQIFGS